MRFVIRVEEASILTTGPPRAAAELVHAEGRESVEGSNGERASNTSFRKKSNSPPWNSLVPVFETALTWPPPGRPRSPAV